jgi:hypothetical protein
VEEAYTISPLFVKILKKKMLYELKAIEVIYLPNLSISILLKRVKIVSNCSFKHGGILRYDAQSGAQIVQSDGVDVYVIYQYLTYSGIDYAKERLNQG